MAEKYRIETLIWDLDGTVADTRWDVARAVNYTMRQFQLPELPEEQAASYLGGGLEPLLKKAVGPENEYLLERMMPVFKEYYHEHSTDSTVLYPGVKETIEHFDYLDMALATNKLSVISRKILAHLEILDYFQVVLGPDSVKNRKPHPEAVHTILEQLGNPRETAMLVGDSHIDVETGRNAGIITCGVTYGIGSRQELEQAGPDLMLDDVRDLVHCIS